MKNNNLQKLIFAALMVAIGIILSNILSISYPPSSTIIRIGFGYLPLFLVSILLGPKIGIAAAIVQDLFGWILFGYQFGPFFPGYTLNAVLYGVIPYIIYNLKTKVKRLFVYMNFGLLSILLGLGVWALFRIDWIFEIVEKKLTVGMDFSPWIIYLILGLGILGVLAGFVFIYFKKDEDDKCHRIIFSVIILQIIVSLVLTPLWVVIVYSNATFLPQLPLRIVKTPLEVFVYSILLIRLMKVFNNYKTNITN